MNNFFRLGLAAVCLFFVGGQYSLYSMEIIENPENPAYIVGSLYANAQDSPNIEQVTSWGSYLYLSVRYLNGDQKLEVWDVRDPANPVMSDSLDFGNLITEPSNHWRFPSVNVFDDRIVVRSNFREYIYYHAPDGQLTQAGTHDFAAIVGEMPNEEESLHMSSASSYGTYFGRLFEPSEAVLEEEFGYLILNFTNPDKPFIPSLVPPTSTENMVQQFTGHLTGSLENNPAVVRTNGNHISIHSREIAADSHLDVYWEPNLPQIFNMDTLDRSVRAQIDRIAGQQPYAGQISDAIGRFFDSLNIDSTQTIEDAIVGSYDLQDNLAIVLDDYDIEWDQSVRVAVERIVSRPLSLDLEKELSQELFAPALAAWTGELFRVSTNGSRDDLKSRVANVLNDGLSDATVARFILDKFIAPYVDLPGWMYWTMEDVVNQIEDTPAGAALTASLQTANIVVNLDGFLEKALSFIPPAERYLLPAGFPEDCRDILEYAFFEHGAKLERGGLAFMEIMKLYQYYSGNDDYLKYNEQLAIALSQVQDGLADALTETIAPFLSSLSFVGDVQERLQVFAGGFSCKQAISLAIQDAITARLVDEGIDVDLSLREVLIEHRLYLDVLDLHGEAGSRLARVEDFLQVLQDSLNESQTQIRTLWDEGKNYPVRIEEACRNVLAESLRESWGQLDLDRPMKSALRDFIGNHVDYRWTFGENMDGLLKDFVFSSMTDYPGFLDYLSLKKRADDGDVIARWQLTFQLAKIAASTNIFTLDLAIVYEYVETTLEEAYKQALTNTVKALLWEFASVMANEMYGSFSNWATRTEGLNYSLDAGELTSLESVRNESFVWDKFGGLVAREEWDFLHSRKLALVLYDPGMPVESKEEILFEGWGGVDSILFHQGNLVVTGSMFEEFGILPAAMLVSIEKDRIEINRLQNLGLASAQGLTGVNHNAHLVFYGPSGIYFVTNPRTVSPSKEYSGTGIRDWMCY